MPDVPMDGESLPPDMLERGLRAGLPGGLGSGRGSGAGASGTGGAGEPNSVLARLEKRTGSWMRLHLPSSAQEDEPVLKVKSGEAEGQVGSSRYSIAGEIARGGVGVIYQGRDMDLGRCCMA